MRNETYLLAYLQIYLLICIKLLHLRSLEGNLYMTQKELDNVPSGMFSSTAELTQVSNYSEDGTIEAIKLLYHRPFFL